MKQPTFWDVMLDEIELSHRTWQALRLHEFLTVGDVDNATDAELLRVPNVGAVTLQNLRSVCNTARRGWQRCGMKQEYADYVAGK
jgi:DNA-directed RNA polymerase alpha subunit